MAKGVMMEEEGSKFVISSTDGKCINDHDLFTNPLQVCESGLPYMMPSYNFFKPENFRIGDHQSILFKEHLSLIRTVILELDSSDVRVPGRKETVPKASTQGETKESHLDKHPQNYTETKGLMCQHTSRKAQVRTHECEDSF